MKKLFLIIALLLSINSYSQQNWKLITEKSTAFTAGFFYGVGEAVANHSTQFLNKYPDVNVNYWIPKYSWKNKWKNGDPSQGERFPFSSTALVWTTDAYHLSRTLSRAMWVTNVTVSISDQRKPLLYNFYLKTFKVEWLAKGLGYLTEGLTTLGSYQLGFHLSYSIIMQ